ncbi:hypothetical protein [Sulfurimonas sp. HSL3-7]|uniref:hypothetical protein n=1 Tax=Sulfonitrofixus jiaomeiensis TaxID=3131938 RepID=UPI0031F7FBEC
MSKKIVDITTLDLAHTTDGKISVVHIERPYGEHSSPVVSVGISVSGEDQEWKVHIPYENLDDLINALNLARRVNEGLPHELPHTMDLGADIGGGQ